MNRETLKIKAREIKNLIDSAQNILLIAHKKPDGDTLGATISMYLALQNMGKNPIMACADNPPQNLQFLPEHDRFVKEFDPNAFDLIITLDNGASYMSKFQDKYPDIFNQPGIPTINIDHHPSNDNFGQVNLVDTSAAATSITVYQLLRLWGVKINREMATCLLTGVYTDTGSFMHSNTNAEVYQIAAELLSLGGNFALISKQVFKNTPLPTLKLWGRVLQNIKMNSEKISMSVITQKDLETCQAKQEDLAGVIDLINAVPEAKFSVLLVEDKNGQVKGSFRTQKDDVNLSKIAGLFGGGGHEKAAGFTMPGHLKKETYWRIVAPQDDDKSPETSPNN